MENNVVIIDEYFTYLESLERCDEIIEQILQEKINIDSLTKRHKEFMKKGKQLLKDNGISIKLLEAKGKAIGANIKKQYEQGKTPKETSKLFLSSINKLVTSQAQPLIKKLEAFGDDVEQKGIFLKVAIAVLMFMIVIVINTIMMVALSVTFGPTFSFLMTTIVVAPFVEEAAKAYFISAGMPWTGTGIVFGIELVMYVTNIMSAGGTLTAAIIIRAIGLMMHFATTYIQKIIRDKSQNEFDTDQYAFAGWVAGVAVHMTWNCLALIYNKEIASLMGI